MKLENLGNGGNLSWENFSWSSITPRLSGLDIICLGNLSRLSEWTRESINFCLFFLYFLLDRIFCARQKQNFFWYFLYRWVTLVRPVLYGNKLVLKILYYTNKIRFELHMYYTIVLIIHGGWPVSQLTRFCKCSVRR